MLSSVFIVNERGKTIYQRNFREDESQQLQKQFIAQLPTMQFDVEQHSASLILEERKFVAAEHNKVYFVAACEQHVEDRLLTIYLLERMTMLSRELGNNFNDEDLVLDLGVVDDIFSELAKVSGSVRPSNKFSARSTNSATAWSSRPNTRGGIMDEDALQETIGEDAEHGDDHFFMPLVDADVPDTSMHGVEADKEAVTVVADDSGTATGTATQACDETGQPIILVSVPTPKMGIPPQPPDTPLGHGSTKAVPPEIAGASTATSGEPLVPIESPTRGMLSFFDSDLIAETTGATTAPPEVVDSYVPVVVTERESATATVDPKSDEVEADEINLSPLKVESTDAERVGLLDPAERSHHPSAMRQEASCIIGAEVLNSVSQEKSPTVRQGSHDEAEALEKAHHQPSAEQSEEDLLQRITNVRAGYLKEINSDISVERELYSPDTVTPATLSVPHSHKMPCFFNEEEELEAAAKEAAEREAAEKEAADREAAEKEAADREAADREAAEKEAAEKEAADREAAEKEAADREAAEAIEQQRKAEEDAAAVMAAAAERPKTACTEPEIDAFLADLDEVLAASRPATANAAQQQVTMSEEEFDAEMKHKFEVLREETVLKEAEFIHQAEEELRKRKEEQLKEERLQEAISRQIVQHSRDQQSNHHFVDVHNSTNSNGKHTAHHVKLSNGGKTLNWEEELDLSSSLDDMSVLTADPETKYATGTSGDNLTDSRDDGNYGQRSVTGQSIASHRSRVSDFSSYVRPNLVILRGKDLHPRKETKVEVEIRDIHGIKQHKQQQDSYLKKMSPRETSTRHAAGSLIFENNHKRSQVAPPASPPVRLKSFLSMNDQLPSSFDEFLSQAQSPDAIEKKYGWRQPFVDPAEEELSKKFGSPNRARFY